MAKLTSVPLDLAVSTLSFLTNFMPQEQLGKIRAKEGKLAKMIAEFFLRISPDEPTTDLDKVGNLFRTDDWGNVVPGATPYNLLDEAVFPWSLESLEEQDPLVDCAPWTVGHYHQKVFIPQKLKRMVGRNPYTFDLELLSNYGQKNICHTLYAMKKCGVPEMQNLINQKPEYGWHLFRMEWSNRDLTDQMLAYYTPDFATLFCLMMAVRYKGNGYPQLRKDEYVHIKSATLLGSEPVYLTFCLTDKGEHDYTIHFGEHHLPRKSKPLQVWCRKKPIYALPD